MKKPPMLPPFSFITHNCRGTSCQLLELDRVDSTNSFVKSHLPDLVGIPVSADCQTAGRGRLQRHWFHTGDQLAFSFALPTALADISALSLPVGLSVHGVLKEFVPAVFLKWPNDILVADKKICGILCESIVSAGATTLIVGIGINLTGSPADLPPELRSKAGFLLDYSLSKETKRSMMCRIFLAFQQRLTQLETNPGNMANVCAEWIRHSPSVGRKIRVAVSPDAPDLVGIFDSLDQDGRIRLRKADNSLTTVFSGDVSFI